MGDQTINSASDSSPQAPALTAGELVSTVEISPFTSTSDQSHGEATNPEAQKSTKEDSTTGNEGTEPDKPKGDEFRFDKHPRFQELNRSVKEFREQNQLLRDELEAIKAAQQQQQSTPKQDLPFKDWSKMTDDELLDWQATDPKDFFANLNSSFEYAVTKKIEELQAKAQQNSEKQRFESSVAKTFESYAKENPDFDQMWDSGEIQDFMQKNPGHNAISAHMAMTGNTRLEKIRQEAAEKAVREYEAAQRSKRASKVMGAAPATVPTPSSLADDRLKNPNKYGGEVNVLVARLQERRRQQGF